MGLLSFLGSAVPSAVSAVGNIGSSLISAGSVNKSNDANMKLAQYQYEQNLAQWNRENEYNSPKQQMARLAAAGLNPNLIYGNGVAGATGNTSTSSPRYEAPKLDYRYDTSGFANAASSAVGTYLSSQQVKQTEQNVELSKTQQQALQAQILATNANTLKTVSETKLSNLSYETAKQLQKFQVNLADYNAQAAMFKVTQTQLENKSIVLDMAIKAVQPAFITAQTKSVNVGIAKSRQEIQNLRSSNDLTKVTASKVAQEILNLQSSNNLTKSQVDKIHEDIRGIAINNDTSKLKYDLMNMGITPGQGNVLTRLLDAVGVGIHHLNQ